MMLLPPSLFFRLFSQQQRRLVVANAAFCHPFLTRCLSSRTTTGSSSNNTTIDESSKTNNNNNGDHDFPQFQPIEDGLTMHYGVRPRFRSNDTQRQHKFKSPQRRASKLFHHLQEEAVRRDREANPHVWNTPFRVGDAIEISYVERGGINSNKREKLRGVVLGRVNRGLGTSVYIRDVVFGEPIDRKVPLHSPLVKSVRVLEENFVFKNKRRVKRAKLYYLRDRLPNETKVSKY